jgi:hypothetical protein
VLARRKTSTVKCKMEAGKKMNAKKEAKKKQEK